LLGVLYQDGDGLTFRQFVFDPIFESAIEAKSRESGHGYCTLIPVEEVLRTLAEMSESENRVIVAWSTREIDAIESQLTSSDHPNVIRRRMHNGIKTGSRWRNRFHPDAVFPIDFRRRRNALQNYFELIDYDVPRIFGPGTAAKRVRDVRNQLVRHGGDYSKLTRVAKGKWSKLLSHNYHDCVGMREVIIRATRELG
jgi:hypothetical protein